MAALVYIVDTLIRLYLLVLMMRLVLQWSRADFRNPIARAIVQLTNPVIRPLRRILPAVGQLDTASLFAICVVVLLKIAAPVVLYGYSPPAPLEWLRLMLIELVKLLLYLYLFAIFLYTLLLLLAQGGTSAVLSMLYSVCEPLLRRVRRVIPPIAGLDLSALWILIAINALLILLP
ncbi:MAG: YggT family protein [Steroidobacteraceae bacterium]